MIQYASMVVFGSFVSFHKDQLNRQNFIILQLVKDAKDRRIQTLRGEKRHLEILADVAKSAGAAKPTHIKFVDVGVHGSTQDKGADAKHSKSTGRVRRSRKRRQGNQTESMASATCTEGQKPNEAGDRLCTDRDTEPSYSKSSPVRQSGR
jgi:hypothetical protein